MSQIPRGPGAGSGGSRLAQMQAQFQQKQMQEKEAKLLQMLDSQQQKALQKAGLNGVLPPSSNRYSTNMNVAHNNNNNLLMNGNSNPVTANLGAGKVRQMFEERRKHGGPISGNSTNGYGSRNGALTGIDKGHPLEPLVVTHHSGGSNKSRSSSSKSDPANYVHTNGMRNTQVPPITKPTNLGSSTRATSLNRDRSISRDSPAPTHNSNNSVVSSANSTASSGTGGGGGVKPYQQRQQKQSSVSHPPPPPPAGPAQNTEESYHDYGTPLPTTTKYSDYAQELEKRENALASKLKKASISSPDADYYASNGRGGGSPTHKSTSPNLGSAPTSPVRVPSKASTTMNAPGARSAVAGRTFVSSTSTTPNKASSTTAKKAGGVIKAKPPRNPTGPPPPGSESCKVCGRNFDKSRIAKHEQICKKTTTKKRKVFDPTKMRMQGTEAEPYIRVVSAKPTKAAPAPSAKKVDWRKKHEEFIATIRAAKEYQAHVAKGGDPADLPPPPPTDTSDYIQCPHCNRKFSEGAAERHIPKCKNIKSNKR